MTGSDGEATKRFYVQLEARGPFGAIAVNLFRAQKASARAKVYRGGGFRGMAYDKKNWAMAELCRALSLHATVFGITWGWKRDPSTPGFEEVLYVELPNGQVSFHSATRLDGPDFAGEWDRQHGSTQRVVAFCQWVFDGPASGELKREDVPEQAEHKPVERLTQAGLFR